MIVCGYTLDLYCDSGIEYDYNTVKGHHGSSTDASFAGRTKADCFKQARRAGWSLNELKRTAICPKCRKAKAE